jgi:prepilin-type processing-associated H-X9-DG protein
MRRILFSLSIVLIAGCSREEQTEDVEAERLNKMRVVASVCFFYVNDYNGLLPNDIKDLKVVFPDVIQATFPKGEKARVDVKDLGLYSMFAKGRIAKITNPATTVMCREKFPDKDGFYAVAFVDGHVELIKDFPGK